MPGIEIGGEPIEVDPDLTTGLDPQYLGDPIDQRRAQACATEPRRAQACTEFPRRLNACGETENVVWAVFSQIVWSPNYTVRGHIYDCPAYYEWRNGTHHSYPSLEETYYGVKPYRWFLANFDDYYTDYSANPTAAPPLSWRNHPTRVIRTRHFMSCLEGVLTNGGGFFGQALPRWGSRSVTVGETTYNFPSAFTMAFFIDELRFPMAYNSINETCNHILISLDCCYTFHPDEFPECYPENVIVATTCSWATNYTNLAEFAAGGSICCFSEECGSGDLGTCQSWIDSFPAIWWYGNGMSRGELVEAGIGAIEVVFGYDSAIGEFPIDGLPKPDRVLVRIEIDTSRVMDFEPSPGTYQGWFMELTENENPITANLTTPSIENTGTYYEYTVQRTGNYVRSVGFTSEEICVAVYACANSGGDFYDATPDFRGLAVAIGTTGPVYDSCQ